MKTLIEKNENVKIKKDSVISYVYETYDYDKFYILDGNRELITPHIKRLTESMSESYLLSPILVNNDFEIIDGQHRFTCAAALGLPIRYIICDGYGLSEVQKLNALSKNWGTTDHMDSFISLGYKTYKTYKTFFERYKFSHKACMLLLSGGENGAKIKEFHQGKLAIKDLSISCSIAEKIIKLDVFYDGYKRTKFIYAIIRCLNNEKFSFDIFLSKLKNQPSSLTHCVNTDQYVELIENIYNYHNRNKINLRF